MNILLDIDTFFEKHISGIMRESYFIHSMLSEKNVVEIKIPRDQSLTNYLEGKCYRPLELYDIDLKNRFNLFYDKILKKHTDQLGLKIYSFNKMRGPLQTLHRSRFVDKYQHKYIYIYQRVLNKIFEVLKNFFLQDQIIIKNCDAVVFPFLSPTKVIGAKKIIRHHDVIPIELNETNSFAVQFKKALKIAVKNTDVFVCNSKDTEDKLLSLYPELKGKTCVIYVPIMAEKQNPCDLKIIDIIKSHLNTDLKKKINTLKMGERLIENQINKIIKMKTNNRMDKYFIFVADITPRKNLDKVLQAFLIFLNKCPDYRLVVVGRNAGLNKNIAYDLCELVKQQSLFYVHDLQVSDLYALIENAEALLSFSTHEGFGAPPAEALMLDTPIILSDINVYREIYEDAAIYAKSGDVCDLANKMIDFVKNSRELINLSRESVYRVKQKFAYEHIAQQWNNLIMSKAS